MIVLTSDELDAIDVRALEELTLRTEMVVAFASRPVAGLAAAAFLLADFAVLHRDASLRLDAPEVWAGAVWRIGRRALLVPSRLSAPDALVAGLCDETTDLDAASWREQWMRNRSELALDTAAALIRMRGGDALERAAFAWLFACGEPQKGLAAFLEKRKAF